MPLGHRGLPGLSGCTGANSGLGNQPIWANGQRDTSNCFLLNGVDASNLFNGKSTSQVNSARVVNGTNGGLANNPWVIQSQLGPDGEQKEWLIAEATQSTRCRRFPPLTVLGSVSGMTRSEPRDSACPGVSWFNGISPIRFSSLGQELGLEHCTVDVGAAPRSPKFAPKEIPNPCCCATLGESITLSLCLPRVASHGTRGVPTLQSESDQPTNAATRRLNVFNCRLSRFWARECFS